MKIENKVCLYIFTHNITGLKYFGKTNCNFNKAELLKYGGSGSYWNKHLKKHGKDISVEIYGIYNIEEVKEIALKFSRDNDIVSLVNESGPRKGKKVWANLIPENGIGGITRETVKNRLEDINSDGLNSYQRAKAKQISRELKDIDSNNLNGLQRIAKKRIINQRKDIDENGLNSLQRSAIKTANTKREDIDENGLNGLQRAARKMIENQRNNIREDGKSILDIRKEKYMQTRINQNIEKYGKYKLIIDNKIKGIFSILELKKISTALLKSNKEKPLGNTNRSISRLKKLNKEYLIGSYIEKLSD